MKRVKKKIPPIVSSCFPIRAEASRVFFYSELVKTTKACALAWRNHRSNTYWVPNQLVARDHRTIFSLRLTFRLRSLFCEFMVNDYCCSSSPPETEFSQMALRGVWQLQKLIVSYCDWGGSSRGIRVFMEKCLPTFKEQNPQLEVVNELIRGQHPHLKAFYRNKNERVVCVKNLNPEDILLHATRLRNAQGRKVVKLKTRHFTQHPSVQGTWTTATIF